MFLKIIKSEQFLIAVLDLIQILVLNYWVGLPPEIWGSINAILLVLIGAITAEQVVEKASLMLRDTLLELRK